MTQEVAKPTRRLPVIPQVLWFFRSKPLGAMGGAAISIIYNSCNSGSAFSPYRPFGHERITASFASLR